MSINVMAPVGYPWTFNGPRFSKHNIIRSKYLPFNRIPNENLSSNLDSLTIFPTPLKSIDLIHAFNRIPIATRKPFIIGFESHLPRQFGGGKNKKIFDFQVKLLSSDRCKKIIPFSYTAKRIFSDQHRELQYLNNILKKVEVIYPSVELSSVVDCFDENLYKNKVKLIFIGSHFARKGGCAVIKLAEIAMQKNFPLEIDIVSSLFNESWVDPINKTLINKDIAKIERLTNINFHGSLENHEVLKKIKDSHYVLLPTFSDTFGFSIVEGMSNYIPAIVTTQGSLPEFTNNNNAIIYDLPCSDLGQWLEYKYEKIFTDEYMYLCNNISQCIAETAFQGIVDDYNNIQQYKNKRYTAFKTADCMFNAKKISAKWDSLYENVLGYSV